MTDDRDNSEPDRRARVAALWAFALAPLALLAVLVAVIVAIDPLASLREGVPPVEDLTIERVRFTAEPREMIVTVVNGGSEPVTVAQVLVDDAYWTHEMSPGGTIQPLGTAAIRIAYPWVEGEPHEVALLTSTGLTFTHTVEVAVATPTATASSLANLALIGIFVGVIPVAIGLGWYPFVRQLPARAVTFLLALTCGVLLFLAVDATVEAIGIAGLVPSALDGPAIFVGGAVVALALLLAIGGALRRRGAGLVPTSVALLIAIGIGFHNFNEGLAIAAGYALGQVAFTTLLVVGFAVHNSTEGLALVTPLAEGPPRLSFLVLLCLVAGAPTIAGTMLGAVVYSPTLAVLFLGLGVGAIAQVVWEIAALIRRRGSLADPGQLAGLSVGIAVMYVTALIVAA